MNKPHYSSNSSLEIAPDNAPSEASIQSEYLQEEQRKVEPKTRDRGYRSEVMLSTHRSDLGGKIKKIWTICIKFNA